MGSCDTGGGGVFFWVSGSIMMISSWRGTSKTGTFYGREGGGGNRDSPGRPTQKLTDAISGKSVSGQ